MYFKFIYLVKFSRICGARAIRRYKDNGDELIGYINFQKKKKLSGGMDLSIWGSRSYKNLYAYIKDIVFLLFGNVSAHLWIIIRIYENIEGKAIVYI